MNSFLITLALVFVPAIISVLAYRSGFRYIVYALSIVFMLCVGILGGKTITILGLSTNIGSVYFALFTFSFTSVFLREGYENTRELLIAVGVVYAVLLIFLSLSNALPVAIGNESFSRALATISTYSLRSLVASLLALYVVQSVYLSVLSKLGKNTKLLVIPTIFVMQIVDSLVFFTVAFLGTMSNAALISYMVSGLVCKISIALLLLPFIFLTDGKYFSLGRDSGSR